MAIDNYSNLKQAIEEWSHRLDIDLFVDDCITLCQQYIYRGDMPLKVGEVETVDTVAVTTQQSDLPERIIELSDLRIQYSGEYYQMRCVPVQDLKDISTAGKPLEYSVGGSLYLDRTPDQSYTLKRRYFAAPTPLDDNNPTNAALSAYPDLYLWGGVAAALFYAGEEAKAQVWGERLRQGILDANQAYKNLSLGPLPTVKIHGGEFS